MAEDCSFATVRTENLTYCPNKANVGGVKAKCWYIPMAQLKTITKPTLTQDTPYAESITLTALEPETTKGFKRIDLVIDENELKSNLVGAKGNMKDQAQFDGMIPNFVKENVGFIKRHKNTPMCYVVEDSAGQKWVVLEAYMTKADATTAKKYDENSGTAFNVTANDALWAFDGDILELADTPVVPGP